MKKENILRVTFLIIFAVVSIISLCNIKPVETSILKGFTDNTSEHDAILVKLANLSSYKINAVAESDNEENLENLKTDFLNSIKPLNFKNENFDFGKFLTLYKENPRNFLTANTKNLLVQKKYAEIDNKSLEMLYNPLGIFIQTPDKDPYLFVTDYVLSLQNPYFNNSEMKEYKGKYYTVIPLKIIAEEKNFNSEISKLITVQKEINSNKNGHVYLTGTPIHSYFASTKSVKEINIICFISILALIWLCKYYFKSYKILIPIISSILFGSFFGYVMTNLIFNSIHILTFVFSTTLIGISLDYSLHYYLTRENDNFIKNLTTSMLTTVFAFCILIFSDVEVLKQIAVYTASGLIGVYAFVLLILPKFDKYFIIKKGHFKKFNIYKLKKFILLILVVISILGLFKIKFNDDIRNFYTPDKNLLKAETIFKNAFPKPEVSFIPVNGNSINEIVKKEEQISKILNSQQIENFSLSKILPSTQVQMENQDLVQNLYENNLSDYGKFLSTKTISNLKNESKIKKTVNLDFEKNPYLNNFMLDKNTSYIILFNSKNNNSEKFSTINVTRDISNRIRNCRKQCMELLPFMFFALFLLLYRNFGLKKSFYITLSPILGTIFSISFLSLFNQPLNLFNILALFLIIGFSLDYSIFRANGDKTSEDAVFMSFASTALSFLLLSFTSFKLISSLGTVLFLGITTSYILSLILLPEPQK